MKFTKYIYVTLIVIAGLISFGCVPNTNTTAPTAPNVAVNSSNANAETAAANTNLAPEEKEAETKAMPVTLPVLDAMFYDDKFVADAKAKLNLTAAQIEQIRAAATQNVEQLGEDSQGGGSTKTATEDAEKQIAAILGADKTNQLFDLVRQSWSGSNEDLQKFLAEKPNAIPTDTRVVVNAPAYRMDLFKDGELVKSYTVGIGYPEFPLPNGLRTATTIIFNPTWTPPNEPWVKGKVKPGKVIAAGSKGNPLGPIKIPIGSPSLIHGGKSPAKLGTFASHGCVGLTNPLIADFALELAKIADTNLTRDAVNNFAKTPEKTNNFKLDQPIPVELRYETIVVEDGKLKIYRDVYERGTNTEKNLRSVLSAYGVSLDDLTGEQQDKIFAALDQMNRNAAGKPIVADIRMKDGNSKTGSGANETKPKNKKNDGSVTSGITGKKEMTIEIAALEGKGYPAPLKTVQTKKKTGQ